jgi:hypothetical protein
VVKVLIVGGVAIVSQSLWVSIIEVVFEIDLTSKMPDPAHGWALILLGMLVFLLNRHDSLALDTINTETTSQIIKLSENRFSITFSRPMRCVPSIVFTEPQDVIPEIENWNDKGFTAKFPRNKHIENIRFEADAKPGPPLFWYKLKRIIKNA